MKYVISYLDHSTMEVVYRPVELTVEEERALHAEYAQREATHRERLYRAAQARRRHRRVLRVLAIGWTLAAALLILGALLKAGAL